MFRQIGALLDEQGVAFKPAAYRRGAQVIEELSQDVANVGGVEELKKLPSIGEAMAKKIVEYLETGKIAELERLRLEQGGISADLMDVEGLGPKRVRQLHDKLGIHTVPELLKAAQEGKLRDLELWDEKLEQKILQNLERVEERTTRFDREEIKQDVEELISTIRNVPAVEKAEVAGSYRRQKETVGDIDILAVTDSAEQVSEAISQLPIVRNVVARGDTKISFDLQNGLRVDVRLVSREQWGAALLYFTGSKEHNIAMRKVAIKKGWKLNEYGLFKGDKVVASREEEDIYKALGLRYYEPHERIGRLL